MRIICLPGSKLGHSIDKRCICCRFLVEHQKGDRLVLVSGCLMHVSCLISKPSQGSDAAPIRLNHRAQWVWQTQSSTKTQGNGNIQPLLHTLCTQYILASLELVPVCQIMRVQRMERKRNKLIVRFLYLCSIYSKMIWHYSSQTSKLWISGHVSRRSDLIWKWEGVPKCSGLCTYPTHSWKK